MSYIGGPIIIPNASRTPMPPGSILGNPRGFSVDEETGPTTLIKLPNGEVRRVPTSEVPKDKGVDIFGSTTGEGTVVPKPTASEKKEKEGPQFNDFFGMDFQEYLNKMEGIQDRAANKKMLRGQIASIPDLMAAGNLAVAQANRDIAKASSEWGVALTKQKPWEAVQKWSPQTQFDYRLGS